jgi:hypothetical protein
MGRHDSPTMVTTVSFDVSESKQLALMVQFAKAFAENDFATMKSILHDVVSSLLVLSAIDHFLL